MKKIGKYDLVRELGHGGTSTVYLGYDPFAQRDVAIKIASPDILRHPERGKLYTNLFLNEASLVGKLAHPHIVQIFDAVVAEDLCYIVMEYVQGSTLETCCRKDQLLPIERISDIIFKCTRALGFAHHKGIIHRDIKPANILYVGDNPENGDIKISDFGAAIVGRSDRTIVSGIGSPAYMSPEQVRELPLDHRTDIYSLGIVMYQLLTGHLPFQSSNNYNMIYQIINSAPPLPSSLRPDIPDIIDRIISLAIHKDADVRYSSWEDFARDLTQVSRQTQIKALIRHSIPDLEKFNTLRRLSFFNDFPDAEIWEVLHFSDWSLVAPDEVIMRDDNYGGFFCFVVDGELMASKNGHMLNLLTTGDCFGEMAVVSKHVQKRGADITALTNARIITIKGAAINQATETCRMHFYQAFMEVMANRLTLANARLATLQPFNKGNTER